MPVLRQDCFSLRASLTAMKPKNIRPLAPQAGSHSAQQRLYRHQALRQGGLALMLLVLVLLVGGISAFLSFGQSAMKSQQQIKLKQTQHTMKGVTAAIYGFTTGSFNRLPCPDVDGDGLEDRNAGACDNAQGNVPWVTLGVEGKDGWGRYLIYRMTLAYGDDTDGAPPCGTTPPGVSFSSCSQGDISLYDNATDSAANLNPIASNIVALILSTGRNQNNQSNHEAENTDADTAFILRYTSSVAPNEFNDLIYTISHTALVQTLVGVSIL